MIGVMPIPQLAMEFSGTYTNIFVGSTPTRWPVDTVYPRKYLVSFKPSVVVHARTSLDAVHIAGSAGQGLGYLFVFVNKGAIYGTGGWGGNGGSAGCLASGGTGSAGQSITSFSALEVNVDTLCIVDTASGTIYGGGGGGGGGGVASYSDKGASGGGGGAGQSYHLQKGGSRGYANPVSCWLAAVQGSNGGDGTVAGAGTGGSGTLVTNGAVNFRSGNGGNGGTWGQNGQAGGDGSAGVGSLTYEGSGGNGGVGGKSIVNFGGRVKIIGTGNLLGGTQNASGTWV